eukprot:scaffold193631_cov32-Tisochrysis_lutea.AAC.3
MLAPLSGSVSVTFVALLVIDGGKLARCIASSTCFFLFTRNLPAPEEARGAGAIGVFKKRLLVVSGRLAVFILPSNLLAATSIAAAILAGRTGCPPGFTFAIIPGKHAPCWSLAGGSQCVLSFGGPSPMTLKCGVNRCTKSCPLAGPRRATKGDRGGAMGWTARLPEPPTNKTSQQCHRP